MAFYDLCVPLADPSEDAMGTAAPAATVAALHRLGYGTVALEQTLSLSGKAGKVPTDVTPLVDAADRAKAACEAACPPDLGGRTSRVLSRLTVVLTEPSVAHLLNGTVPGMKRFDIVAVAPATEKMWAMACEKMDVDVIALDLSRRLPFFVKPKQVNVAIDRGIHFEIGYAAAIADATARRNVISNAIQLVRASRGRNIVISSKAERAILARGPYDVANLARLFGMSPQLAKAAVSVNARAAVSHGAMRCGTFKGVAGVTALADLGEGERWMVPPDPADDDAMDEDAHDAGAPAADAAMSS